MFEAFRYNIVGCKSKLTFISSINSVALRIYLLPISATTHTKLWVIAIFLFDAHFLKCIVQSLMHIAKYTVEVILIQVISVL